MKFLLEGDRRYVNTGTGQMSDGPTRRRSIFDLSPGSPDRSAEGAKQLEPGVKRSATPGISR